MTGVTARPAGARVFDVVRDAAARLERAGLVPADARADAGVLARWVLGWDAATWLVRGVEPPAAGFRRRFEAAVARRVRREPVSHITGVREFYGRTFEVTPDVLTPRPETEALVTEALSLLAPGRAALGPTVIDVGTGSGCLAVTLALEAPGAPVLATDVSAAALDVARRNAGRHGILDRVTFEAADLVPVPCPPAGVIVANPPYVPERDRAALAPEVARYEPGAALFAGEDGLDVIRRLVPAAARTLRPGGHLVMEIGAGQAGEVRRLVEAAGLACLRIVPDLQGIPRVVVALRPA